MQSHRSSEAPLCATAWTFPGGGGELPRSLDGRQAHGGQQGQQGQGQSGANNTTATTQSNLKTSSRESSILRVLQHVARPTLLLDLVGRASCRVSIPQARARRARARRARARAREKEGSSSSRRPAACPVRLAASPACLPRHLLANRGSLARGFRQSQLRCPPNQSEHVRHT